MRNLMFGDNVACEQEIKRIKRIRKMRDQEDLTEMMSTPG